MSRTPAVPLKRDRQWDFACVAGPPFYDAQVRHVLQTRGDSHHGAGELPWRTEFGTPLDVVRHGNLDAATVALVRNDVRAAFERWLPHLNLVGVDVQRLDNLLRVSVKYAPRAENQTTLQTVINSGGFTRQ